VLLPAKTTTAEEAARLLYDNVVMVLGCCCLVSDRGSCFISKLFTELCKLLGIKHLKTSPRHAATNSRCESFNRNILNSLRTDCNNKNWPTLLSSIGFTFRTSVLTNVGFSPFAICYRFEARLPLDDSLLPSKSLPTDVKQYFEHMKPKLDIIRTTVGQNQQLANERTQGYYNLKAKLPIFEIRERVWLHEESSGTEKLQHKI